MELDGLFVAETLHSLGRCVLEAGRRGKVETFFK